MAADRSHEHKALKAKAAEKKDAGQTRKLFGTDGIRGKANIYPMTPDMALRLGQAAAAHFIRKRKAKDDKVKAVIGKDTRLSGYIFEHALAAGLCSMGVEVHLLGPMPTPAIAHLTRSFAADFGIVISASHNSAEDNGIKIFDSQGYKLADDVELEIEQAMLSARLPFELAPGTKTGKAYKIEDARGRYVEFVKNSISNRKLDGLKVVLDCSNGAAYIVAPLIFRELGAEVIVYNNKPDGLNINKDCGSLHPDIIRTAVLAEGADIGIALDGDADRVILVDEKGNYVDGDHIMAIAGIHMKKKGLLKKDTVVATVMSNLGFEKSMIAQGINVIRAAVGDRYVIESMRSNGFNLGGEQSGHIIFSDHVTTGDGTLTALQILGIMKETKKSLSELSSAITVYPQVLQNVPVRSKIPLDKLAQVTATIRDIEARLGQRGRVLVRYSGTENKCRVMIEGPDEGQITGYAAKIAAAIRKETD